MTSDTRLIFVSNRLPVTIDEGLDGPELRPSSGGLVTALRPILHATKGYWIGWTGTEFKPEFADFFAQALFEHGRLVPVLLTEEERKGFYCGFSNEIVWPLFHDLQSRCNFDPAYWKTYVAVNQRFAEAVARVATDDAIIWVHDYHLMLLGTMLRRLGVMPKLAFFQHIPFPPADIFEKLPWRSDILRALFDFDVVGFQTQRDQRNFAGCVRRLLPEIELHRTSDQLMAILEDRTATIGTFPIGIDFEEFSAQASLPDVRQRAKEIRRDMAGCQIVLGVDRLDYTKGIPERLRAFQNLLATKPELHHRIVLVQVVVPSREDIPKYQELKLDVERLVSRINGEFGKPAWVPVLYIHRHLERLELLALYRAADIALITPLKDGMNLVAKEFCAAQVGDEGVLILSEFAGAADQLRNGAILVNPYDIEKVAAAIDQAFKTSPKQRKRQMRKLRRKLLKENVFRWCERFCAELERPAAQIDIPKHRVTEPEALAAATPGGGLH
jgi:alpha,alpha-trehalose-phosphate synthase [UDP-forming]